MPEYDFKYLKRNHTATKIKRTPPRVAPITTPRDTDPSLVDTRDGVDTGQDTIAGALEFVIAAIIQYGSSERLTEFLCYQIYLLISCWILF